MYLNKVTEKRNRTFLHGKYEKYAENIYNNDLIRITSIKN